MPEQTTEPVLDPTPPVAIDPAKPAGQEGTGPAVEDPAPTPDGETAPAAGKTYTQADFDAAIAAANAKAEERLNELSGKVNTLSAESEAARRKADDAELISRVKNIAVEVAEEKEAQLIAAGMDPKQAKQEAWTLAAAQGREYLAGIEAKRYRDEVARTKAERANMTLTESRVSIAQKYGIQPSDLAVFTTQQQMEQYAKRVSELSGRRKATAQPLDTGREGLPGDTSAKKLAALVERAASPDATDADINAAGKALEAANA